MIRITNEIDGKKYELVPATKSCMGCAFEKKQKDYLDNCKLTKKHSKHTLYQGNVVCIRMNGIWKEVRDAD